jgi:hypothetical protein
MTQTLNIANHNGSNFAPTEETEWPAFNDRQEYCGQIYLTRAWAVPNGIYEELGLRNHVDLYLTSKGQWAATLEHAEHYLSRTEPPTEFKVKGASLGLFICGQWAEDNGSPNVYSDYQVFKHSAGYWDAEEIEEPPVVVGAYEEF